MRTTVDIDDPILEELKRIGKIEGKSLGRLMSDLLVHALQMRKKPGKRTESPHWITKDMKANINLGDKESLYAALDAPPVHSDPKVNKP